MKKIGFILLFATISFSCTNNDDGIKATVNLKVNECFDKFENDVRICLDSVFNDSRCPTGVVCVWEGDAVAAFTLTKNKNTKRFNLHANTKYRNDTLIDGIRIKLINVSPYPTENQQIDPNDYVAEISVDEN